MSEGEQAAWKEEIERLEKWATFGRQVADLLQASGLVPPVEKVKFIVWKPRGPNRKKEGEIVEANTSVGAGSVTTVQ